MSEIYYSQKIFSHYLRSLREKHEFNQGQIANVLHVERSTYTNYELGKVEPKLTSLCKLSNLFKVSTDELLSGGLQKTDSAPKSAADTCHSFNLDKNEKQLLCYFRSMPPAKQKIILETVSEITKEK